MDLEVRHIRVVHAVAVSGSLTKAAGMLAMSQPALTAQLKRIERVIGGVLFDRGRGGARLTALGRLVLSHAERMLPLFDALERDVRQQKAGDALTLIRVGAVPSAHAARVRAVCGDVLPGSAVELSTGWSGNRYLELLAAGLLELVLITENPVDTLALPAGTSSEPLGRTPLFAGVSARHPLADRAEIALTDLADERWLLGNSGDDPTFDDYLRTACQAAGFAPREIASADPGVMQHMTAAGEGVMLLMATSVTRQDIIPIPLRGNPLHVRHRLAWRNGGPLPQTAVGDLLTAFRAVGTRAANDSPVYAQWLRDHPQWMEG